MADSSPSRQPSSIFSRMKGKREEKRKDGTGEAESEEGEQNRAKRIQRAEKKEEGEEWFERTKRK